jgi:hypothetical protein
MRQRNMHTTINPQLGLLDNVSELSETPSNGTKLVSGAAVDV